jgi:hypothetical protein
MAEKLAREPGIIHAVSRLVTLVTPPSSGSTVSGQISSNGDMPHGPGTNKRTPQRVGLVRRKIAPAPSYAGCEAYGRSDDSDGTRSWAITGVTSIPEHEVRSWPSQGL